MKDNEIDCLFTSEVVCPYCGAECCDSWEFTDEGEVECENCEKEFRYERYVEVSYISKAID